MRKPLVGSSCVSIAAAGCLLAVCVGCLRTADPTAPELSQPPAILQPQELGDRQFLFDGRTTAGFKIEGPHAVQDGTLELGGTTAARAVVDRAIAEGQTVEFDFFQEGKAEAKLWLKPTLIKPQRPDPDYAKDVPFDLGLSGFLYPRWHHVVVQTAQEGSNAKAVLDIRPHHGGPGRQGGAIHSIPARGGSRWQLVFETSSGAKLQLRNVVVQPRAKTGRDSR